MIHRPKRRATDRWLVVTALSIVCIAGCTAPEDDKATPPAAPGPQSGGTLVMGASSDIAGINELLSSSDTFTQSVIQLMFLHLFQEQPDFDRHPPSFAPELAESWEWSADHLTLTVHLRTDVVWSNGEPVTAEDVVWTWQAQTNSEVAWGLADAKQDIVSMEAVDEHTVRVIYQQPSVSQLFDLNLGVILPKAAWGPLPFSEWRQNSDWFVDRLVTSGPFQLDSWVRQQQIVLRRNERFHEADRPLLDRVVFRIVPQKTNQIGQLLAGDLHLVGHVPASEAARIEDSPSLRLLSYWPGQYDFIAWNTARSLFSTAEMRRALTMAIDRRALVEALWFGRARVSTSPIVSSVWAHNRELQPWPYDLERARRALAVLGWTDSDGDGLLDRGDERLSFELVTNANSTVRVDAAVMIQEQLRRVGIEARVLRLEFNTLVAKCLAHDFDAMLGGWTIDTSLDLSYAFHSKAIESGYNFGSFSDPEVDRLIERAEEQTDPVSKGEILRQVQLLLHRHQPYTFLWEPQRLAGTSRGLQDARPNALDPLFDLKNWWLVPTG